MQRFMLIILILSSMIMLALCHYNKQSVEQDKISLPSEQVKSETNDAQKFETNNNKTSKTPEPSLVYKNTKFGYQLIFPKSWRGNYVIDEDEDIVKINFYGKSKTGTILGKSFGEDGLPMFMIVDEKYLKNETLDNVREIGEINGIKFYYATTTDSNISALVTIDQPDGMAKLMNKYPIDETEIKLAKEDWEKVEKMYSEKDELLKTFGPIKN